MDFKGFHFFRRLFFFILAFFAKWSFLLEKKPSIHISFYKKLLISTLFCFAFSFFNSLNALLFSILIWISLKDIQEGIIDDLALGCLIFLGIFQSSFLISWNQLYAITFLFLLAFTLKITYHRISGKHGLGWGDVKLMGIAGLWIPFNQIPAFFIITGLVGLLIGLFWRFYFRKNTFPLGPAIAFALWIQTLWITPT